jgi:putative N6-adenine-specific DNA methylase
LFVVFNPPYDERIQVEAEKLYASIGTTLKHKYPGTQAWMITSNMEALKQVGLRPSRRIKLYNGKLESKLVRYDMYEGSKKAKKESLVFYFL